MASPQKENGFTPIANELVEHLVSVRMSGTEWQYVMCIFRKTYGWNKKEDWITNSQIVTMTGLKKERVSEAKSRLIKRNIVTEKRNKISIQKDWEKWVELRKSVTIVTEKRNSELRKSVHTKETITKENIGETSSPLKANQEDMIWNKQSDNDEDLPSINDDGEIEQTDQEKLKKENEKVRALMEWGEKVRGKTFLDKPTQIKHIKLLKGKGISPTKIKDTFVGLVQSDYWKNSDRLPDFKTVVSTLKNER